MQGAKLSNTEENVKCICEWSMKLYYEAISMFLNLYILPYKCNYNVNFTTFKTFMMIALYLNVH